MRVLLLALLLVSCGSTPSPTPTQQLPAQSAPATSTHSMVPSQVPTFAPTPTRSSVPSQAISHQFAGRLTFPPSKNWKKVSADSTKMILEFSGSTECKPGECARLELYTERFTAWESWFENNQFTASSKQCGDAYKLPQRSTDGDIMVGGTKGEYYRSVPCKGSGNRHTWLFDYIDGNNNSRGVRIDGFPIVGSVSGFPYEEVRMYIGDGAW